jgi:sugar (pentulose or hexulose) kinase
MYELLDEIGLNRNCLPVVKPPGSILNKINPNLRNTFKFSADCEIVAGISYPILYKI